ncbi:hypothetical protein N7638_03750 [Achromobacter mucicolens]|uniref:toxin VasX n=1 Tax=Achromobacter mucicolens TaxID=1389922 RepID=UPI002449826C|nr:toxin VasX [Achromobacter mucicolens]MDG9967141.1 hypothetical protein [Achromobacter mucicolens]
MTVIAKTPRELSASTTSGSCQSTRNCVKVLPFFPLRYAVAPAEKGGYAYNHPNLENGFPALDGAQYVLRGLRDDDGYLYIHDPDNREQILCFVYRSTDGSTNGGQRGPAKFQRLQLDDEFRATALVGELLPFPYIPAYEHKPALVSIWFADTLLSPRKLTAFLGNTNNLRSVLATEVNLVPWLTAFEENTNPEIAPSVRHTIRLEDVTSQQAVGLDGKTIPWSEYPHGSLLPTTADMSMAQGPGSARFAVVLHDPVGLLSELSAMIAPAITEWAEYNAYSQRALWVSKVADSLLDPLYRKAYEDSYNGDLAVRGSRGTSATGYPRLRAVAEAERAGNAARDKRRKFLDDDARQEFLKNDLAARDRLMKSISQRTEPLWKWWNYAGAGSWGPSLTLYDLEDDFSFRAMRGAIARCVLALAYHEKGSQALADQLLDYGPIGVFHYAMLGHPAIAQYVNAPAFAQTTAQDNSDVVVKTASLSLEQAASAALKELDALFKSVPPDAASQQISQITLGLLGKKGLLAPERFPGSRYSRMLEVLDGSIAVSAPVLLDEVPNKLRQTLQVKGLTPFRRTKLNAVISESMPFFEAHAASVKETERIEHFRGLERRISLWHGLKLGASTLGMWGSAVNLSTAIKRLGQHDGDVIARLLDVGNNAAGTVASGYGVQSAMQYVAMQRAAIRANGLAASVSNVATTLAERRMIGALSVSALAGALKAGGDQLDARGKVRTYIIIDSLMQFSEAAVAAAYLFGGKWGEMFGIAALTKFSSRPPGPVGVGLVAFDVLRTLWGSYVEGQKSEQKVCDWLEHCLWGNHPQWDSPGKERLEFTRLHQEPRIETDMLFNEKLGKATIPVIGPVLVSLMPVRTVTVLLPGWLPQASAYALTQYKNFGSQGKEQGYGDPNKEREFGDPSKVKLVDGVGYLTVETATLIGDTVLTYWPNAFSDPEVSFTVKN